LNKFHQIFVEKDLFNKESTQKLLTKLDSPVSLIDSYEELFQHRKKYLDKRTKLNLILANKKGELVKETPPAYGQKNEKHFYFLHQFNCVYECEYCYLQGYFNSPDIVIFLNHEEILEEIKKTIDQNKGEKCVFHAGEFSDSLALNPITQEWKLYFDFFEKEKSAEVELRTKSTSIQELLDIPAPETKNIIVSFSLSTQQQSLIHDKECPSSMARIRAIERLIKHGYGIALHFDPIIYEKTFFKDFENLCQELHQKKILQHAQYMSLGTIRFTPESHRAFAKNYPENPSLYSELKLVKNKRGFIEYEYPFRNEILRRSKEILLSHSVPSEKIYYCMEEEAPSLS